MNDIIFNINGKLSQQCCIFQEELQELLETMLKDGNVFQNARYYENSKYSLTLRAQNVKQKKLCAIQIFYFPFVDNLSTLNENQLKGDLPFKFILSQSIFKKFLINEYTFDIYETMRQSYRFQDLEQNQNNKVKHLKDAFKDYFELKYEFGNDVGNGIQQSISSCTNLISLNMTIQIKNNSYKLSMRGLCKGITECKNISTLILNLIFCGVDGEGAIQIGNTIGKCSNLQNFQLNLDGSQIGQDGVIGLAEGISYCQNLFCLVLSLNFCYIQGEELQILLQKIQMCPLISKLELHLSENELNYEDLTDISSQFSQFSYLYQLTLSFNFLIMMPDTILKIANDISQCQNLQYLSLNLKNCELNEDIAGMLGDGLSKCQLLKSLNLNLLGNESIQTEGVLKLLDGIINCQNINNLSINLFNCFFSCLDQFIGRKIRKMSNLKQLQLLTNSLVQAKTINHIRKALRLVNFIRQ
ncbi:kinase domain protein, putative (macronuclear) [Tetrahymena thermophila SB210]|uniref:Kinase domain protein, putative n=1 Tax=Tetrahymena thermophila (strain SB210) TaxID=312017 RepID=W7XDF0_TETTS|nr:kinase domain protein, putative [Tetrahymena thermophila SB210]EWS74668.1 kinase domain protein, putative [Tetrahymena thermophila SB210]|eukprot:XP_012652794.1 kinase domain protein, putative [Tetrahymena thermophila SB210]